MTQHAAPSIATHIPLTEELPTEGADLAVGREDLPTPSLWQRSVRVRNKLTGEPAIVHRVDWGTSMFRAFYPSRPGENGEPGRFGQRTEWEHCRQWDVEVTYSPNELERQATRKQLEEEIAKLDEASMALVTVLCDDPDPKKAMAKLRALIAAGMVKGSPVAAQTVLESKKGK
jgi:hypothetical protein